MLMKLALKVRQVLLHELNYLFVLEVRNWYHSFGTHVRDVPSGPLVLPAHLASTLSNLTEVRIMEWFTLSMLLLPEHACVVCILRDLLRSALKFDRTRLLKVVTVEGLVQMAKLWYGEISERLLYALNILILSLVDCIDYWTPFLLLIGFLHGLAHL